MCVHFLMFMSLLQYRNQVQDCTVNDGNYLNLETHFNLSYTGWSKTKMKCSLFFSIFFIIPMKPSKYNPTNRSLFPFYLTLLSINLHVTEIIHLVPSLINEPLFHYFVHLFIYSFYFHWINDASGHDHKILSVLRSLHN